MHPTGTGVPVPALQRIVQRVQPNIEFFRDEDGPMIVQSFKVLLDDYARQRAVSG